MRENRAVYKINHPYTLYNNMKNKSCFECGKPAQVNHHVIPRVMGGTKTVPLCDKCHSLVHDSNFVKLKELSLRGKEKVRREKAKNKVLKLFKDGLPKTEIARKVGIDRRSVYYILEKNGLHVNMGRGCEIKVTPEVLDNIKTLRNDGKTWADIEQELDICHTHLFRIIKQFGLGDGKYNGANKYDRESYRVLTSDMIEQARKLRMENKTWDEIGDILGVQRQTLYYHGLPQQFKPLKGKLTPEKRKLALKLRKQGKKWKDIADQLDISDSAIYMSGLSREARSGKPEKRKHK